MDATFLPTELPDSCGLPQDARIALAEAVRLLEETSLPVRVASLVGMAAGRGVGGLLARLPAPLRAQVSAQAGSAASQALDVAYRTVLPTLGSGLRLPLGQGLIERAATVATGVVGGAGGLAGTMVELPLTTALLLRAIARIARDAGEDPRDDETRAECLKVLAIGAPADGAGYHAIRLGLAEAMAAASGRGIAEALPRLASAILPRFGVSVTWKVAGQAIPVAGAAAGGLINLAFTAHYQDKARGHFAIRRLERAHGAPVVRACYEMLAGRMPNTTPQA